MRRGGSARRGGRAAPARGKKGAGSSYLHGRMFYGKFLQDFKQDEDLNYTHVIQLKLPEAIRESLVKAQAAALTGLTDQRFHLRTLDVEGVYLNVLRVQVPAAITAEELQAATQSVLEKCVQGGELQGQFGPLKTFTQKKLNSFIFFEAQKQGSLFHFAASLTQHFLSTYQPGVFPDRYDADQLEVYDNPELSQASLVSAPLYIPLLKFRLSQDEEGRLIERLHCLECNHQLGAVTFKPDIRILTKEAHLAERKDDGKRANRSDPAENEQDDAGNHRSRGPPRNTGGRGGQRGRGGRGGQNGRGAQTGRGGRGGRGGRP